MRPSSDELERLARLLVPTHTPLSNTQYLPELDDTTLLKKLDYHGITLLVDGAGSLPENSIKNMAQRKAMMAANETLKRNALRELFDAFANANLNLAVLFKGSALAYTVYAKPWLRPRSDSDVIIEPQQRGAFDKVFNALGYQKAFAIEGQYVSYQSTYSKVLAGESVMNIDLHWHINNRQILAKAFTAKELFENGENLDAISSSVRIPSAVDSILIASLHRLGHHQNEERLAWLYDIHLLIEGLNDEQWRSLIEKSTIKKLSAITLDALNVCVYLFATNVSESKLDALKQAAKSVEPSQVFLQRDLSEWRYFLYDLKALPTIFDKLGFIKETLFPSPNYVRAQMSTNSATLAYIKRFARGFRRVL